MIKVSIGLRQDNSWPAKLKRHCLFLVNVIRIEDNRLIVLTNDDKEISVEIANKIYNQSGYYGKRTPPYLCLIMVRDTAKNPHFYKAYDAAIVPRYSNKSFFPVDSFYEREMLKYLYQLHYSLEKEGIGLIIEKPLFEIAVQVNGESCSALPDFLLKTADKTIVVEVNGSTEPEYVARKKRTQVIMAQIGPLFVFNAAEFELQKKLAEAFKDFIIKLKEAICLASNP